MHARAHEQSMLFVIYTQSHESCKLYLAKQGEKTASVFSHAPSRPC